MLSPTLADPQGELCTTFLEFEFVRNMRKNKRLYFNDHSCVSSLADDLLSRPGRLPLNLLSLLRSDGHRALGVDASIWCYRAVRPDLRSTFGALIASSRSAQLF